MQNTRQTTLQRAARLIHLNGLHRGEQFASLRGRDVSAAIYQAAEGGPTPPVFFTDEVASIELIEDSEPAMDAIRALSDSLDSDVCETNGQPDYIEHVSNWAATAPIGEAFPPTTAEVISRVLRAADQNASEAPYCTGDRCEDCTADEECCEATCGCCPRVNEHDHCRLAPGSEENSKYCDQHGEGWLYDRSPQAELKYQILRGA